MMFKVRLAYISDEKFWTHDGEWYSPVPFPIGKFNQIFPFVDEWIVYGRLYYSKEKPEHLYHITTPPRSNVNFMGPFGMPKGLNGYIRYGLSYLRGAYKVIKSSKIVWVKLPYVTSLVSLFRPSGSRVIFCHMVGDPKAAGSSFRFNIKASALLYSKLVKLIISRCDFSVFVSRELAHKYKRLGTPWIVANESKISDELIMKSRSSDVHVIPRILYVGRLSPEKNIDTILFAVDCLKKNINVELWIVGSGDELDRLERLEKQLGIVRSVKFLGRIPWGDKLFQIMRESDVLVLPSKTEGLPLVLIEAMSQGLPVVASDVGGIPEIVKDEISGLLVSPGSVDDLTRALYRILTDKILRDKIISNGFEVARENTIERQTGKIATIVWHLITHDISAMDELQRY